jgi:hypothetical protein
MHTPFISPFANTGHNTGLNTNINTLPIIGGPGLAQYRPSSPSMGQPRQQEGCVEGYRPSSPSMGQRQQQGQPRPPQQQCQQQGWPRQPPQQHQQSQRAQSKQAVAKAGSTDESALYRQTLAENAKLKRTIEQLQTELNNKSQNLASLKEKHLEGQKAYKKMNVDFLNTEMHRKQVSQWADLLLGTFVRPYVEKNNDKYDQAHDDSFQALVLEHQEFKNVCEEANKRDMGRVDDKMQNAFQWVGQL